MLIVVEVGAMGDRRRPRFMVPRQGGGARRAPGGDAGRAAREASTGERFHALFRHAPLGVALSSLDGRFTEVNLRLRGLLEGTGIDPDTAGLADLARYLPDGGDESRCWLDALADVLTGRAPVARAELLITPPGIPPSWVCVTTALVVLGDRRCLLSHLEDTTGRRLAEARLARLVRHDGLTGLATRALLADRLAAAVARERETGLRTGVLYLDLDEFKQINDAFGYEVGDRVLVAVAGRLTVGLPAEGVAGRIGGDEFLMIVPDLPDEAALAELTRRVDARLSEPLEAGPLEAGPLAAGIMHVHVRASVGAALTEPGDTLDTVMRRADRAMFLVKHRRSPALDMRETDVREASARGPGGAAPAAEPRR